MNSIPPCLVGFTVQEEDIRTPVETGAVRHYVPEIGPSEHPYFVEQWHVMFQSQTLAEILTRPRCVWENACLASLFWLLMCCCCQNPLLLYPFL